MRWLLVLLVVLMLLLIATPAMATTNWYWSSGNLVCSTSGCVNPTPGYLKNAYSNQGNYVQWGQMNTPNGACVYYGQVAGPSGFYDWPISADENTGFFPQPSGLVDHPSDYQVGDGSDAYAGCGSYGNAWEYWWKPNNGCGSTFTSSPWCGAVHWVFLNPPADPYQSFVFNNLQLTEDENIGTVSGPLSTRLCALLQGPTLGPNFNNPYTVENLEVCFEPYDITGWATPRRTFESQGSTPEQVVACSVPGVMCGATGVVPAARIDLHNSDSGYGTWYAGVTTSSTGRQHVSIGIGYTQLQTIINDVNQDLQRYPQSCNASWLYYVSKPEKPNDHVPGGGQCYALFDPNVWQYTLIALEQDGEGQGVSQAAWSDTGLVADSF